MAPANKKQKLANGGAHPSGKTLDEGSTTRKSTAAAAVAPDAKAAEQKRSLFVRALPPSTTTDSLTQLFSESYPIKHATAVTDPETKQCRGYGFVTFADAEDAARARVEFHGHALDGRKLRVELAEPRNRDGTSEKVVKPAREPEQPPKLIVRNLPWSIKKTEHLSKLFLSYGKVKHAYIPTKGPGLMAGFGFVVMRGKANAERAIEGVNGKVVDGRTLAVDWAVDRDTFKGKGGDGNTNGEEDTAAGVERGSEDEADESEHLMPGIDDEVASEGEDSEDERDPEDVDDDEDADIDNDLGSEINEGHKMSEDRSSTLFVRNLPFTCTDEDLEDHFAQFGSTRYARVVVDAGTERSKGTGFVCFYKLEDADACLRNAPRPAATADHGKGGKDGKAVQPAHSILQNAETDPSGQYTLDGRVLQITEAVNKNEANRLTQEGVASRNYRDKDKRRLYLLSEGSISYKSAIWDELPPSEKAMREASSKQRKSLVEGNPSLHLSWTRLSIRNVPRSVGSKELKALARDAVVGFASDVKAGLRERLSREEIMRGSEEMQKAETARKRAGKGIVKQAKVVFEASNRSKVNEDSGAGRSRGYGFIEYYTHRNALMGLRWLNGHAVGTSTEGRQGKPTREDVQERKKRLIAEFAIENAQVVLRRNESQQKARDRSQSIKHGLPAEPDGPDDIEPTPKTGKASSRKRKRDSAAVQPLKPKTGGSEESNDLSKTKSVDEKLARRNQIIGRKRAVRVRKGKS